MATPEGEWAGQRDATLAVQRGYAGRPIALDDTCGTIEQGSSIPVEPSLWFDSPIPVGTRHLAEGWVEQTGRSRETLTVATTTAPPGAGSWSRHAAARPARPTVTTSGWCSGRRPGLRRTTPAPRLSPPQHGARTVRIAPELVEPWFAGGLPAVLLSLRD